MGGEGGFGEVCARASGAQRARLNRYSTWLDLLHDCVVRDSLNQIALAVKRRLTDRAQLAPHKALGQSLERMQTAVCGDKIVHSRRSYHLASTTQPTPP